MSEQRLIERLAEAIDAIMAGRREGLAFADPELATLLVTAADLRDLPDPRFKEQLMAALVPPSKEDPMSSARALASKPGFQTVTPYLVVNGAASLIEFLQNAFGAQEHFRAPDPEGRIMHAEMKIGDSMIELGDASDEWKALTSAFHVYVEDADTVYQRALAAGATSVMPPTDQPYGDHEAGVVDPFGNHWYIATHLEDVPEEEVMRRFAMGTPVKLKRGPGVGPAREGFRTITAGLRVPGTARLIEFLSAAFGAEEISRTPGPEGTIMHAELRIGDSMLEAGDPHGPWPAMPCAIHLFVDDVDSVYERAIRAGARSIRPPADMPYGERGAAIADPGGNQWFIATPK